ncbi:MULTISPECIES: chemotaxis protein CheW [Sinorhizobium]|uniref:chemotaxis protein CheW n=1 Tax=Sinorhizobium TaxID=28105 RepID=UPI000BE98D0E|nr:MULTISPECIES: chemotaxis protein CheW [Sinorhizobium]PDT49055.1 chemotaxis protein CheW [Sinorhizobium sp. NG07B]POH33176.1 chemotaxis protein [Sinorhizobium americanum]
MTMLSRPAARPVDWIAVRRRIEAAIEQTEALLESAQKAAQYEQSRQAAGDAFAGSRDEQTVGLVTFMLSDRRFALEIRYVCEIVSKARVSPLPGMPPHACGVYDLRGELLPVFDLSRLFDLPRSAGSAGEWAIVCGRTHSEFLILSDSVPEIVALPPEEFAAAKPGKSGGSFDCARTEGVIVFLDGHLLLNDRRLVLEDEQIIATDETERTEFHEPAIDE